MIGLAVVVALALAAVFGAMSLTNPAFAAVGAPADAELAERTFSPQDTPEDLDAIGGDGSVTLKWKLDDGADGYNVSVKRTGDDETYVYFDTAAEAAAVSGGPYSFMMNAAAATATGGEVTGLINGDEYCFRVQLSDDDDGVSRLAGPVCATPMETPRQADDLEAEGGNGEVVLEWDEPGDEDINVWQVIYGADAAPPGDRSAENLNAMSGWEDIPDSDDETDEYTVTGLKTGTQYWFAVRALNGDTPSPPAERKDTNDLFALATTTGTLGTPSSETAGPRTKDLPSFAPDSKSPGSNTRYTIKFDVRKPVNTLINDLVIEFHEDYSVPSAISTAAVTVTTGLYKVVPLTGVPTGDNTDCYDDARGERR